jgi:hypothetical protein
MLMIICDEDPSCFGRSRLAVGMIKLKFERLGDELLLLDDELYPDVILRESFGN